MMSSTPPPPKEIHSEVIIYENERAWIGGGFSKVGLLPTDRRSFSTRDGSLSWKSRKEAGAAMLGKGWVYEEEGFVPVKKEEGDSEGWCYATDFSPSALEAASNVKRGMKDFVRFRKLSRVKTFDQSQFLPKEVYTKCDYCDSEMVEEISTKILETLTIATLLHSSNSSANASNNNTNKNSAQMMPSSAVVLGLQSKLIGTLRIGSPLPGSSTCTDPRSRLKLLYEELDKFRENQKSILSKATSSVLFNPSKKLEDQQFLARFSVRAAQISNQYFPKDERDAISRLVIRHFDKEFKLHCNRSECGETCEFFLETCPNTGCHKQISRKRMLEHDDTCEYKLIPCPLNCGDSFPRNRKDVHLADVCSLRMTFCPFHKVGCTVQLHAKDIPSHLMDNMQSHLLLATNRMMEYEDVINQMSSKIKTLEEQNSSLMKKVETADSRINTAMDSIEFGKKENVVLGKGVKNAASQVAKLTKKLSSLESTFKTEFEKIDKRLK